LYHGSALYCKKVPTMVRRDEVIQSYLDLFDRPTYLEIGVSHGVTFNSVKANRKIAVDPKFEIEPAHREPNSEYYEIISDLYFETLARDAYPFHVIYLDGLHTFEQTLRDLMNAIEFLRRDGIIIIDDVFPDSYHASLQDYRETVAVGNAIKATDHSWMGSTYRLVFFIQSFLPRFNYATVEDNHGQLVMWRANRPPELFFERQIEDISRLEFRHVVTERNAFNFLPNTEIVRHVRQTIQGGAT
jgi:hypothetical protein